MNKMATSDYSEYKYPSSTTTNKSNFSYKMVIDSLNVTDLEHRWVKNVNNDTNENSEETKEEYISRINQQSSNIRKLAYIKAKFIHNYGEQQWPSKISDEEKEEYITLASLVYSISKEKVREELDDKINQLNNSILRT